MQALAARAYVAPSPLLTLTAVACASQAVTPNWMPGRSMQVAGNVLEANRWWQRGAKAGDVESMFKAGFAMYERCEG